MGFCTAILATLMAAATAGEPDLTGDEVLENSSSRFDPQTAYEGGYELHLEEGQCEDAPILERKTDGVEDCGSLCLEEPSCRFFSVMVGGWCKLTAKCDYAELEDMEHSDIYRLPDPATTTTTTGAGGRTVERADAISIEISASVGKGPNFEPLVADAISACTMQAIEPGHVTFSYADAEEISVIVLIAPPSVAMLEQVLDRLEACDSMKTGIVEGLEAVAKREVVVHIDPPQLVDTAAPLKAPVALPSKGWCCLGSWLFDDPCSECLPSLTPRGVAMRDHPCAGGEEACRGCGESWADPMWCPGSARSAVM